MRSAGRYVIVIAVGCAMLGCGRRPADADATSMAASASTPDASIALPPSAMRITWTPPALPPRIAAGAPMPLAIEIRNSGDAVWPAANSAPAYLHGRFAVRISHRWCGAHGVDCPQFTARHDLPASVPPGASQTVGVPLIAPSKPGLYELQFDAVQELVSWFSREGGERLMIPVRVE